MEDLIFLVLGGLLILFIPIIFTEFVEKYYIKRDEEKKEDAKWQSQ